MCNTEYKHAVREPLEFKQKMEKFISQWHRVGISINQVAKSNQYCCFASPEVARLLFKEIEINERYFAIMYSLLID